ncbi:hypothetical protein E2C01_046130 [Portunus trituberculatus]|uniref:Uncharacterized protein n=1 Tax=Portunus trituberculatus TaxID=210409 RepID=A0A5B7G3J9_PORTR|nr:hypothetical protein [Portunus trituberculatus]
MMIMMIRKKFTCTCNISPKPAHTQRPSCSRLSRPSTGSRPSRSSSCRLMPCMATPGTARLLREAAMECEAQRTTQGSSPIMEDRHVARLSVRKDEKEEKKKPEHVFQAAHLPQKISVVAAIPTLFHSQVEATGPLFSLGEIGSFMAGGKPCCISSLPHFQLFNVAFLPYYFPQDFLQRRNEEKLDRFGIPSFSRGSLAVDWQGNHTAPRAPR